MVGQKRYVPPPYIPIGQSDAEAELLDSKDAIPAQQPANNVPGQWSSGICACFDDMQSLSLGSGTQMGSCTTHFILWGLVNSLCCVLTDGVMVGLPGCFVACYACGYRGTLRSKYNLQEAPCGDFFTHFFCHLCAVCQEYREIRERSGDANAPSLSLAEVKAPTIQTMEPASPS